MRRTILLITFGLLISLTAVFAGQQQKNKQKPRTNPAAEPTPAKQPDAKPAQPKQPAADDQWALLVGISNYPGQIQKLTYPSKDAHAIKDLLTSSARIPEDHIRLLTDDGQGDARATKQNILAAIDSFASRVQPNHQVIVFLAGHGIARGLGAQAKSYFLPVDVDASSKDSLERTGLDLEDLSRRLGSLKAAQFTVFMDACREDPFPGRGIKGNTMTDVMARGLRVVPSETRASSAPTSVVFYACQVGERAYEDPKLEHGVFTYFILNGIRDLANRPDGRVEAGYLAAYLRENIAKWSEDFQQRAKYPVEQTPTMTATEVRGPVVIVKLTALAKDVQPPKNGSVSLLTSPADATLTLNGQALGTSPAQKELAPGEYTVRAEQQGFQPTETKITVVAGVQQEVTLTLKPSAVSANYDKGVKFEADHLWPQAIVAYEMAMHDDPSSMAVYDRLSNAYLETARYRDAVDLLQTATDKFPDNTILQARRSRALSKWASVEPTDDLSTNNSRPAKAVNQKDARKEAVKAAEAAAQKAPNSAEANMALGYAYALDPKDQSKANAAFVRASTIAPEDAEGYYGVGYTYRLMKQYSQAIPQLKKALDLRPDYYDAHRELAYCYHATDDKDNAIREYNTATGYRSETNNSGEMAGNNLALSALYQQKGQEVGGTEGEQISAAGKGYESEARDYDPTLKAAMKVLSSTGLSSRMQSYLPSEVRNMINDPGVRVPIPGGSKIKIPFGKKP